MAEARPDRYRPIGDYALIGDCHSAALVALDGAIDWYCPLRFDAPALFCRLLDADQGGFWSVAPSGSFTAARRYDDATNVLQTEFHADGGRVRLTDLMPVRQRTESRRGQDVAATHEVFRLVEGLDGEVELELRFKPTFDFARARAEVEVVAETGAIAHAGSEYAALATPGVSLQSGEDGALHGRLHLRAGERRWLVLTYATDAERAHAALTPAGCDERLAETRAYWKDWAETCTYQGPYREQVLRSVLVLKLLTYEPTGAVIAAPTTSLPETIGGVRNWDYRYSWLRDSSLIMYALMTVGYRDEATDFIEWLGRAARADPAETPQIMYTIDGGRDLPERTLDYLEGYRGSRPVRTGNAAAGQRQLDIYGELLTSAYLHFHRAKEPGGAGERGHERDDRPLLPESWVLLRRLVDQAAEVWQERDHGIWEVRGEPRHFLYSKLMCWAALDRGIRLAQERGLEAPLDRWQKTCAAIRDAILTRGYNKERGTFTQAFDGDALDASVLAIPRIGFLPATDPRVRATIERICEGLTRHGLVYRYRTADGIPGGEGTFALCSFWLVDGLALSGRLDEAHDLFERVLGFANDLGLLSEELDPSSGTLLGNFPQGFTHLGLVRSAVNLAKAAKHGAEEESENEAQRAGRARHAAAEGYSRRGTAERKRRQRA